MNDTTATTQPTLREEFLTDVLVTAVEGAIGYWSRAGEYTTDVPIDDRGVTLYIDDVDEQDVFTKVLNAENVDLVVTRVTLADIATGINRVIDPTFKVRDDIRQIVRHAVRHNDGGDIDAEIADVIIQAAVFGEIVFG